MSRGNPKVSNKIKNKIPITFNDIQLKLIEEHMGILGNTRAEVIRNIVINWLLTKKGEKNDQ
ncbi:CopG family transcriptional regulator [Candidatus Pacearchaeota archaeon CG10_big_fil_rev_8_21_14_0_10_32_14]|nr:MAG: CopG family transcriptional regulator [Candidatus Pacearchaeota archaeon CG10_big_fil_rev_8_21_14_0_10_32_14]